MGAGMDLNTTPTWLIQDLPGVNIQMGLKRVNGDVELLLRLLNRFATDHANDVTKLRSELQQQHYTESRRILHTLKGLTGSIGIDSLHEAIDSTELVPSEDKLYELELLLARVVNGIKNSRETTQTSSAHHDKGTE